MMYDYAMRAEQENLFVIGGLQEPNPFQTRRYFGGKVDGVLQGIAQYHLLWKSLTLHAQSPDIAAALAVHALREQVPIETVLVFKKHAAPAVEALRAQGMEPESVSDEDVFVVTKETLKPVPVINARPATPDDLEAWIRLDRIIRGADPSLPISEAERTRVFQKHAVVLFHDGELVSKANLHAVTEHYAQVGGVATLPAYRGRGYSKECMTLLCQQCFAAGIDNVLLFTDKENAPAQKVYRGIGFRVIDEYMMADYPER